MDVVHHCLNNCLGFRPAQSHTPSFCSIAVEKWKRLSPAEVNYQHLSWIRQTCMQLCTTIGPVEHVFHYTAQYFGLGCEVQGRATIQCLLHIHRVPQEENGAKGTPLFIFTIFLESFGERGKTGMFMKVSRWSCSHPQLSFSVLGPWRINQSQWWGLIAKHCDSS